jgi:hypothetical protein
VSDSGSCSYAVRILCVHQLHPEDAVIRNFIGRYLQLGIVVYSDFTDHNDVHQVRIVSFALDNLTFFEMVGV